MPETRYPMMLNLYLLSMLHEQAKDDPPPFVDEETEQKELARIDFEQLGFKKLYF